VRFVVFTLGITLSGFSFSAPDEYLLGKGSGYPVCRMDRGGKGPQQCLVGLFSHYDEVFPARKVARGGKPLELKRAEAEPKIKYTYRGHAGDINGFLSNNRNTGLLVMKGNTVLVERYQYDRKAADRFQSMSMAKTVVAMLIGVALNEKLIKSIDDRADQYVPALKGSAYGETSLRNLLTMSSGVKFRDELTGNDDNAVLASRTLGKVGAGGADSVHGFNDRARPAGTKFSYSSGESQVLGLVLRGATGRQLADYLSEKIWRPMGAEADASWIVDQAGYELGYIGLNATLRDWGRLGLLLANGGAMEGGPQVIPADWVKAATTAEAKHLRVGVATKNNGYGYQTWLIHKNQPYFALLGARGQGVYVDPKSKIVVVHTAVHGTQRDSARGEQFALFYGVIHSLRPI
jgi:CubicO group peptidase (beta-lactamase class C family)